MAAYRRWIIFLFGWHLFALIAALIYNPRTGTPTWAGSVSVFAMVMAQYSWGFTVAMLLGAGRPRRKWYWLTLLSWLFHIKTFRMIWFIGYIFGGVTGAIAAVGILIISLLVESCMGIFNGNEVRAGCLN